MINQQASWILYGQSCPDENKNIIKVTKVKSTQKQHKNHKQIMMTLLYIFGYVFTQQKSVTRSKIKEAIF